MIGIRDRSKLGDVLLGISISSFPAALYFHLESEYAIAIFFGLMGIVAGVGMEFTESSEADSQ